MNKIRFMTLTLIAPVILIIVLFSGMSSYPENDAGGKAKTNYGFDFNTFTEPPPDSLIQELVIQVADSNLTNSIQRLQDFWSRYVYSDSIAVASYWIVEQLQGFGYTDVELDSFVAVIEGDSLNLWNVVATKEGYGDSSRIIVIGGHYDSYPCVWPWPPYEGPGADDNASGVAGTLEIARILADVPLYDTVKFILFSCEEEQIQGSRRYANNAYNQGIDIELMINLDMIANLSDSIWDVKLHSDTLSVKNRAYTDLMAELAEAYTLLDPVILWIGPTSDHWSFWFVGYDVIFAHEGDLNPYWGYCEDLLKNLTIPYANQVTRMSLATVVTVAQYQSEPTGIEDKIPGGLELPKSLVLKQNYPNPFNPSTTIDYSIPEGEAEQVQLLIYDLRGRLIRTLINEEKSTW